MAGLVLFFQLCVLLYIQPGYNSLPEKVVVGFYGEALCPDCINFGNGPLTEAFKEISEIFTLKYVPWGNAKITSSGKFECQHGEMECIMNTIQACVLHYSNRSLPIPVYTIYASSTLHWDKVLCDWTAFKMEL